MLARYRCVGTLHGPLYDCARPIAGGLFCYGYVEPGEGVYDQDQGDAEAAVLRPVLFTVCEVHRAPLTEWAEHLWGRIAPGMWVPPGGIAGLLRAIQAEDEPVAMCPEPARAVGV